MTTCVEFCRLTTIYHADAVFDLPQDIPTFGAEFSGDSFGTEIVSDGAR